MTLLVEYKFFEPGFYSTDLPDWGTAALVCRRLGPRAKVLVDTGHHPLGTNVEQIVALLLAEGLLGGFHFNNRKYADDDLIVGSVDPFELFRIMREIARADAAGAVAFMIDQSHNVEGKIDAMVQSVMNIQTAYAKALLVDEQRLAGGPGGRGRAGRPPHRCWRRSRPMSVRSCRASVRTPAWRRIRSPPSATAATRRSGSASGAPRRSRARTSGHEAHRSMRAPVSVRRARLDDQGGTMTQRSAFVLEVRPERIDEYLEAHRDVWPEMLDALRRAGHPQLHDLPQRRRRCSDTSSPTTSRPHPDFMAEQEVSARWQDAMAELLEDRVPDGGPPASRRSSGSTDARPGADFPAALSLASDKAAGLSLSIRLRRHEVSSKGI